MGDPSLGNGYTLTFECPRCGEEQQDEFELLDPGLATDWRCHACGRMFSVLLTACDYCGSETLQTALAAAEQPCVEDVVCVACGRRALRMHIDDEHDSGL